MRHCDKCDVDVLDDISNCPLCGRDISNGTDVSQTFLCYPNNKQWVDKRNLIVNILFCFVIIGTVMFKN